MLNFPFSANKCNLCFFADKPQIKKLLLCSGCSLIRYCGAEHQALDWRMHKDFCHSVKRVLKSCNIPHISLITGKIESAKHFEKAVVCAKNVLSKVLQRSLEHHEIELITFPKVCQTCFSYKVNSVFDCNHCNVAAYCCKEHRERDARKHEKICHFLMMYENFYLKSEFCMKLDFNVGIDHRYCSHLFDVLENSCGDAISIPRTTPQTLDECQPFVCASNYSWVATLLYAINVKITKTLSDSLLVYIVGAEKEHIFFQQFQMLYFFANLPVYKNVTLRFIGPQVAKEKQTEERIFKVLEQNRKTVHSFHATTFEDYLEHSWKEESPDIIACFNCGFCEHELNSNNPWKPALRRLVHLKNGTILTTSYTLAEALQDLQLLVEISLDEDRELPVLLSCKENPYKDYRPFRNWEVSDETDPIFFRNGYLSVLTT